MIKEVCVSEAFTVETEPDGGTITVVDPYDGCQLQCPYCFQFNDPEWSKSIIAKTNIPELIREQIHGREEDIYMGSRCDPYMPIEEKYRLTRKCLTVLSSYANHVFITTKADNKLILNDIGLLKSFPTPPTVLMGLSHLNQAGRGDQNVNIAVANQLKEKGIDVWCFITPILPHIMDIDQMTEKLNRTIPIFLDKLRVMERGNQPQKILDWIDRAYPKYHDAYVDLLYHDDTRYYAEIYEKYKSDPRVTFLTEEWGA